MSTPFEDLPEKITLEEEQLLIKKGTAAAKLKIVMANMREAVKYCHGLTQNGGELHTDEIMSLCYTVLCASVERFKPGYSRFFAFSKPRLRGAICRNWKTRDVVKHSKTVPLDEAKETPSQKPRVLTNEERPEDEWPHELSSQIVEPDYSEIFQHEELEPIKEIIETKLNEQERMVIDLAFKAGFNFAEIGRLLGVSRAATQSTAQRAISKIKYQLALRRIGVE